MKFFKYFDIENFEGGSEEGSPDSSEPSSSYNDPSILINEKYNSRDKHNIVSLNEVFDKPLGTDGSPYINLTDDNNTYTDFLNSNADMLRRARIMYESDLTNQELAKNKNMDQIKNEKSRDAIRAKINLLATDWRNAFHEMTDKYNMHTSIISSNEDNSEKTKLLQQKQNKEISYNFDQINDVKNNVLTLRRQVEISMDDTLRKNNNLYLLKVTLVYLLTVCLPIIFIKGEIISWNIAIFVIIVLSIIFLSLIFYNIYDTRNRYALRYNVRKFNEPNKEDIIENEKEEKEEDEENLIEITCQNYSDKLYAMYVQAKQNDQYCEAGKIKKKINKLKQDMAIKDPNKKWCGYENQEDIKNVLDKLLIDLEKDAKEKKEKNEEAKDRIEEELKSMEKQLEELEEEKKNQKENCQDAEQKLADAEAKKRELQNLYEELGGKSSFEKRQNALVKVDS